MWSGFTEIPSQILSTITITRRMRIIDASLLQSNTVSSISIDSQEVYQSGSPSLVSMKMSPIVIISIINTPIIIFIFYCISRCLKK